MSFDAEIGPVSYVVVTFDSAPVPTKGLAQIEGLVDAGRILVLDVEFVSKAADGTVTTVAAEEVGAEGFTGASTGLIDEGDVAMVGEALTPGGVGVVLIYEDLTLLDTLKTWAAEGAVVIAEGPIVLDDLVEAIDAAETH